MMQLLDLNPAFPLKNEHISIPVMNNDLEMIRYSAKFMSISNHIRSTMMDSSYSEFHLISTIFSSNKI